MVLKTKVNVRRLALKPINVTINNLIKAAIKVLSYRTPFWQSFSHKFLFIAEVLDLLNRPVRILKIFVNPKNLFAFFYLAFFVFFFNRLGTRFVSRQLILMADLTIFEVQRRNFAISLNIEPSQVPAMTSNFLATKDTIERNILFHLRIFPIENFFQIFSDQICRDALLKASDIYRIGQSAANYLHSIGAFSIAEEVEVFVKTTCDRRCERAAGIRNESSYLTAVGHMSLMGILIMAKRVGFIKECEISILFDELNYSNSQFAKILINKAKEVGIQLLPATHVAQSESDLELYPVNFDQYELARYCYSSIFREYESKYAQSFLNFEDIDQEIVILAEEILDRYGIKDRGKLVGMHVRQDQPLNRSNRNSDFRKFLDSLAWLESVGYTVVRLGHLNNKGPIKLGLRSIDTSQLDISQHERDAINLYLWSKAQFFIGNLSGGTFPPSLFGVPTLYVDVFPFTHLTLPGVKDSVVPKMLFDLKAQKILDWEESFSKSKTHLQIENSLQLAIDGFQLISYSREEMLTCVQNFVKSVENFPCQESLPLRKGALDAESRLFEFMQRLVIPT